MFDKIIYVNFTDQKPQQKAKQDDSSRDCTAKLHPFLPDPKALVMSRPTREVLDFAKAVVALLSEDIKPKNERCNAEIELSTKLSKPKPLPDSPGETRDQG